MAEPFTNEPIALETLPRFNEVTLSALPKSALWLSLLSTLISTLTLVSVASAANALLIHWPWDQTHYAYLAVVLITILTLALTPISHRKKGWCLREHDIIYRQGLFNVKTTFLPINRIQHIETERGPMERRFGLASIKFYSAGGASADLAIAGLTFDDAESLRQTVLERVDILSQQPEERKSLEDTTA